MPLPKSPMKAKNRLLLLTQTIRQSIYHLPSHSHQLSTKKIINFKLNNLICTNAHTLGPFVRDTFLTQHMHFVILLLVASSSIYAIPILFEIDFPFKSLLYFLF